MQDALCRGFPLRDLTVVEMAEGVAGPFCGRMLAGFGARVIKVERPPCGDWARGAGTMLPGVQRSEASTLHLYLNMGKESVMVDWHEPSGRGTVEKLLESADVLIEDWGRDADFGLEHVAELSPGLIDVSLTPFGSDGPYSGWRSTPLVSLALGGFLYLSGDEDREPLMIPGHQSEYLAGLHAYGGTLMALWERDTTGFGRRVEVSEIESLAALHQFTTVMHTYGGLVRSRHGARWENKGSYGRYPITLLPCKDGYVSFAVSTEGQWDMLFPMVGRPELLDDPRFATFVERREHADEIDRILIEWMKDKTRREVFEFAAGTWSEPASPLLTLSEVLDDPQLRHRKFFTDVDHPDAGTLTYPTIPFQMGRTLPGFSRAPRLGEHTEVVVSSLPAGSSTKSRHGSISTLAKPLPASRSPAGILGDVRVLDLTRVWAGPLATRILGDFGAEVIKISDPRVPLDRTNGTNNKLNRNKSSLALRLDLVEGRELFLDLVAASDVVVENFRPRVMRNFGLLYEDLRKLRPDIVMCSMPGFGTTGRYRDFPAFGPSVEAMTGLPSMMGYEGGPPRTSSLAFPDLVAALNSVAAIMTALSHRRRTGEGQFIDLALTEGPICQIGEHIAAHSRTGRQPEPTGNSHPIHAPYGVYPAAGDDEWVAICITSDDQWLRLCSVIELGGTEVDQGLNEKSERQRNSDAVDEIVASWSSVRDAGEIAAVLQAEGIAAGRVSKNWQLLGDPHLNSRGFFVELEEPDVGVKKYPGQAIRHDGLQKCAWTPSARLGEHTETLLGQLLGIESPDTEKLAAKLAANGVIGIFPED